jgi:hypothetical protein
MTSKTGFLTIIATGLLTMFQPAFAQDYLLWKSNFGFAPAETVEIQIGYSDNFSGSDTTFAFTVTNNFGIVIGLIETTVPVSDPPPDHRIRGFGFITMAVAASPDGVLLINGEPFGDLTASPTTGRYSVGISLSSSRASGAGGGNAPFGNATLSIVAPDGTTRASSKIESDPGVGIIVSG